MIIHEIDYIEAFNEVVNYTKGKSTPTINIKNNVYSVLFNDEQFNIPILAYQSDEQTIIRNWINSLRQQEELNSLVFGKDNTQNIVSCEVVDSSIELFIETFNGIEIKVIPNTYWILSANQLDRTWKPLEGNLYYRFIKTFVNESDYIKTLNRYRKEDLYNIFDKKEAAMLYNGFTYFKGMKVDNVSMLAFDIESTGLQHNQDSKVLLISNTYTKNGQTIRKLFAYDDYKDEASLFDHWCEWVRELNPSIFQGYNIYTYDLPYLNYCANKAGTKLCLGRDGSEIRFAKKDSKFRKDGSQFYDYKKCWIYGREIIDTMFLAIKFDIGRKYENYKLKQIIKQEGLEVKDRQHYDAGSIWQNYKNPEEWKKIKKYAEHDADDSISIYKLMIASFFYLTQSVPKSFQSMLTSASGSQVNSILVRSYLQIGHSIPASSPSQEFEGAISFGNAGIWEHVYKIDIAGLYPSIMLEYNVFDKDKDPKNSFNKMLNYFTQERFNNKQLAKKTGERYYKDLQESQKIVANSSYGFMGTEGLNFNSPKNAGFVTEKGREILQTAINWAEGLGYKIVNADTDSISFSNGNFISKEERLKLLNQVNSLYPEKIRFEDDGYYTSVLVLKAKNYVLKDEEGKIKIKGSALKATMKEEKLKQFIKETINHLLNKDVQAVVDNYHKYIKEIMNMTSISGWTHRKTVTESVLNPERTNEQKINDALEDNDVQMGDKVNLYFAIDGSLKLEDNWCGDHDPYKLIEKLWKTVLIFSNVLDINLFMKYHLKTRRKYLEDILK